MKTLKSLAACALLTAAAAFAVAGCKSDGHDNAAHSDGTAAVKPYPLAKCVVSGEAFEHGQPYTFVRNGQEIKLCCKDCLAEFDKDPAKYLAKLDQTR